MGAGFSGGSLAVFTALAPAGAVAFAIAAAFVATHRDMPPASRDALSHWLIVPLGATWAGFIASATHLGTPANALHAVEGVGRSPLSNEVVAVVAFLFFAGMYWLYTFKASYSRRCADVLAVLSIVSCIAMVCMMALAYSVPTVPSWDTWHAPANLCLSALAGGLPLAAAVLHAFAPDTCRWHAALLRVAPVAIAACAATMACYAVYLGGVRNNVASAADAGALYGAAVAAFLVLSGAGWFVQRTFRASSGMRARVADACACALVLAAVLLARLPFYAAYLSAGF